MAFLAPSPPMPTPCEAMLDASPDLMFFKDSLGIYRLANKAFTELFGMSRETVLGKSDHELFPEASATRHQEADRQILDTGQAATFEYEVRHAGRAVWLQVLKSPVVDPSGRIVGVFCTARNITDSKQSETDSQTIRDMLEQRVADRAKRLRHVNDKLRHQIAERHKAETALADSVRTLNLILDNSPIGIAFVSERTVRWANPRFHDLFAMRPGTITGQSTAVLYPSRQSFEDFGQRHYPLLAKGERVEPIWPMRRADGTDFYCRIIGQLLYPDRPHEGSIWLMEDVTEHRLAEEATLAAERLKREFMDNMSHEIRTPLNGILGMAALLAETPLTDEQRDQVETLRESAHSLTDMLEGILDFSRLDAGTSQAPNAPFRPRAIIQGVLNSLWGVVQHKQLSLTRTERPDVPEVVVGDANGLRRVLATLLSNAVKFTDHGGVTVGVSCQAKRCETYLDLDGRPRVGLVFSVADTGIGLTPEQVTTIFEPFRQVDGTTTRRFGGTGLGLALARRTAEAMGGSIAVTSEPGKGSEFRFTVAFGLPDTEDTPESP